MELFDILNEDGSKTGIQKERSAVHKDGDLHGSVHIWIIREFDGKNKVLLQKRKMTKDSYPGYLDAACTGHIDAGEEVEDAVIRELSEELNLKVDFSDLKFVTQIHVNETNVFHNKVFINNELTSVFVLNENVRLDSLKYQESEIDELLWLDCDTVIEELKNGSSERKYCLDEEEFKLVRNS